MQDALKTGLGRMPAVEPAIVFIIVPPEGALKMDATRPQPQCWVTDDLLCKGSDAIPFPSPGTSDT